MNDKITNGEILRAISELKSRLDKVENKIDNFKYWALAIIIAVLISSLPLP